MIKYCIILTSQCNDLADRIHNGSLCLDRSLCYLIIIQKINDGDLLLAISLATDCYVMITLHRAGTKLQSCLGDIKGRELHYHT